MSTKRVVVALSGGVDSSVAAAILKKAGYDVIGITMQVWPGKREFGGCCSLSAISDARAVSNKLGIPHYVLNFREAFKEKVINNFISEYKEGRTPNPCIRCNQYIKFDLLLTKAKELGADYIATGHYARITTQFPNGPMTNYKLLKGIDSRKDQSYVLYMMNQESLAHTLFPLGELTKEETRKIAKTLGLPVADKEESQEICFIEDYDYERFLKEVIGEVVKPGPILDKQDNIIGMHHGIAFYTIGQRKGLGAHKGKPKYVVKIDSKRNAIIIGDEKDIFADELTAKEASFVSGKFPSEPLAVTAKIRYNSPGTEAVVYPMGSNRVKVKFNKPQRAVTAGQSIVFYSHKEVIGGGIIE